MEYFLMYFSSYNPTIHDLYLYGPGNTGLPTGLNPNCILYDARESYKSIGVRYRRFESLNPQNLGPTAGTPLSLYPNYYNLNSPLAWKISEKYMCGCVHYMGRIPSDSPNYGFFVQRVKQTGLTAGYGIHFWNDTFSGFDYHDNFYGIYNCVQFESEIGKPLYFQGSPEIPGFGNGATFYQIMQDDHGLFEIIPNTIPETLNPPYLQAISIFTIVEDQNINLRDYLVSSSEVGQQYLIYPNNVFYIGGNDTVAPVPSLLVSSFGQDPFSILDVREKIGVVTRFESGSSAFWTGDSSGLLVYKKNNRLYSISHGTITADGQISGPSHANSLYPVLNYFVNHAGISSSYFKGLNPDAFNAMGSQLENAKTLLENMHLAMINKINELEN
jgi:hypothetical protein